MDKVQNLFGSLLREARKKNGVSQRHLAEKTGQNIRSIQKIENGEREPRVYLALRLAEASGMTAGEFFTQLAEAQKNQPQ